MKCPKCNRNIPDDSAFCLYCGGKTDRNPRKSRLGNGLGNAVKRGNTWTARITVGWKLAPDGHRIQVRRTKGGFKTRKAAMEYVELIRTSGANAPETLDTIYGRWREKYQTRIGASTLAGYDAAYKHYKPVHHIKVDKITANMLQDCIDVCPSGKRTKQVMKVVAGLLMKFAIDDDQILKNPAANLYVKSEETAHRDPITDKELAIIESAMDREPYAKYVYALCYLGFRPTEFFSLTKQSFREQDGVKYLVGGSKTESGKNRPVTIPTRIQPIIDSQLKLVGTEYLFPRVSSDGFVKMDEAYFRKWVFNPLMKRLGIEGKVPYSARHTYADKIKKVSGAERDKAALMGHADYALTKKIYQSTDLEDRKAITDQL